MKKKLYLFFKRVFDIILSVFALLIFSPVLLICAIVIKLTSKGPVFFKQNRVGKNKSIFRIIKFRVMKVDAPHDIPTHMFENPNKFITGFGRFLRNTSLDELPQLFNILSGKMTLIGPRPALWNQDDLIAERDKYHANDIKPGLSGLAQIRGRDELEISVKAQIDGEYAAKMSFWLDLKIIFMTIFKVIKREGIKEGGLEDSEAPIKAKNENINIITNENEIVESKEEI